MKCDGRGAGETLKRCPRRYCDFLGDTQEFRAKVTSLRKVDWEVCGLISILFSLKGH